MLPATLWLAGAWVVPVVAHALAADVLLPVVILGLTAALLRGGRTMLDRLMLALLLLLGLTPLAGLLFTFWPWGLAPVPAAAGAISALGLVSILGERPLRLPRPTLADLITFAAALGVAGYLARGYLRSDEAGRIALLIAGEDNARHFSVFDAISRVGGYLFWQSPEAMPDVLDKMLLYPQGWHVTAALLDGFVRSSTEFPHVGSALVHYEGFVHVTYGLLVLTVLWATRWLAGPLLTFWRGIPVAAFLAGVLAFGEFPTLLLYGFVSEILGLALLAGLFAVIARPLASHREQIVLVSALVIGIGFAYQLYLAPAFLAVGIWLFRSRQRIRSIMPFGLALPLAAGMASIPSILGLLYADHSRLLSADGGVHPSSRAELIALAALVAAALITPAGRRLRVWRSYLACCLVSVASLPVVVKAYLLVTGSAATYYFEKTLAAVTVSLLIGAGSVVLLLPRASRAVVPRSGPSGRGHAWRRRLTEMTAPGSALLITVALVASLGLKDSAFRESAPAATWPSVPIDLRPAVLQVTSLDARFPATPGVVNVVLSDNGPKSYFRSLYLSMYQRSNGLVGPLLVPVLNLDADAIGGGAQEAGHQLRLIVESESAMGLARRIQVRYPGQVSIDSVR